VTGFDTKYDSDESNLTAQCDVVTDFREATMAKGRRGLDRRHRDRSGKIEKKHGNTRIGSLRREYGDKFAIGRRKDMMLKTLLKETDCTSLHEYLKRHHK